MSCNGAFRWVGGNPIQYSPSGHRSALVDAKLASHYVGWTDIFVPRCNGIREENGKAKINGTSILQSADALKICQTIEPMQIGAPSILQIEILSFVCDDCGGFHILNFHGGSLIFLSIYEQ